MGLREDRFADRHFAACAGVGKLSGDTGFPETDDAASALDRGARRRRQQPLVPGSAAAIKRIAAAAAQVLEPPKVNPNANHREVWLRDPDGYVVVLAGAWGDLGNAAESV